MPVRRLGRAVPWKWERRVTVCVMESGVTCGAGDGGAVDSGVDMVESIVRGVDIGFSALKS
jgi:hypothetical protein